MLRREREGVHSNSNSAEMPTATATLAGGGGIISESVDREFGDSLYQLTVTAHKGDTVSVEAELLDSGERWRGDFSSRYIEDITTKTGNFKKYSVFVKMLFSSLSEKENSSVFLDLLTYEDLESLKSRAGAMSSSGASKPMRSSNKRYVILTYAAEFDRVHYPLPLLQEEPDPAVMREQVLKLRREVRALKLRARSSGSTSTSSASNLFSLKAENRVLRDENGSLKAQMHRAIRSQKGSEGFDELSTQLKLVKRERDLLQTRLEAVEDDLESLRVSQRKLLKKKEKEYNALADENTKYRTSNRELRSKNRALESELDVLRGQKRHHRMRSASPRMTATSRERTPSHFPPSSKPASARSTARSTARSARNRGPSPYTSRSPSPSLNRPRPPSQSNASSRNSSVERGRSKTPRKRFDPTAYVMEQRAKLEARRNRSSWSMSTPTSSRPSSRNNSRPNSRASSGRSTPTSKPSPRMKQSQTRQRSARQRLPLSNESSYTNSKRRHPRDDSPGRVLHDVQTKLDEYVNKQREKMLPVSKDSSKDQKADGNKIRTGSAPPSPGKKIFNDATAEIADIDTRLQALQHFLSNVRVDGKPPK